MSNTIECSFSLLNEGRKYSGQHRKYVIENAREICYSPETRERIRLREALGYYGHGRRVLTNKMQLQEVDVITLPDGNQAMVSNIPSNVTVSFDVKEDGTVEHTQEILDTETGKIVTGLNASRVGGFSWACPGRDGKAKGVTTLTGFSGFDYVLQPGFAQNRGYVLESAYAPSILESVAAVVGDDKKAEQLVAGWRLADAERISDLEDQVFESENRYFDLKEKNDGLQVQFATLTSENAAVREELEKTNGNFKHILESIAKELPFFIPENAMHDMLEGDFTRARAIFESASKLDYSQYPLPDSKHRYDGAPSMRVPVTEAEFGSTEYGFGIKL